MDQEFLHIQRCMQQLNGTLVIIHPQLVEISQMDLIPQLFLQIKIYGSKLIDLYQTLDEICPSERQEKANFNSQENVLLLLNQQSQEWQINSQQILSRAFVNFEEEYLGRGLELLQNSDYYIQDQSNSMKILQQAHRVKDSIMIQLFQYVNYEGPDLQYKQQGEMIHQLLLQYDEVLPQLLEENQKLKLKMQYHQNLDFVAQNNQNKTELNDFQIQRNKYLYKINQSQLEEELIKMKKKFIQLEERFDERCQESQTLKFQEIANESKSIQIILDGQLQQSLQISNKYQQENLSLRLEYEDIKYKLQNVTNENKQLIERLNQLNDTSIKYEQEHKKQLLVKLEREKELEQQFLKVRSMNHVDKFRQSYEQSLEQLHNKFSKFRKLYEERVNTLLQEISQIQRAMKQKEAEVKYLQLTVQKLEQLVGLHEKGQPAYRPNSTHKFKDGQLGHILSSENKRLQDVIQTSSSELSFLRQQLDSVLKQQVDMEQDLLQTQKENSFLKQKSFEVDNSENRELLSKYQKVVEMNEYLSQQLFKHENNESIISQVRLFETTNND